MGLSKLRELVMDREARRAAIHGVAKSQTWLSDCTELKWNILEHCFEKQLNYLHTIHLSKGFFKSLWHVRVDMSPLFLSQHPSDPSPQCPLSHEVFLLCLLRTWPSPRPWHLGGCFPGSFSVLLSTDSGSLLTCLHPSVFCQRPFSRSPDLSSSFSRQVSPLQSCESEKWSVCRSVSPTLCDPVDSSPPGSFDHGILQARILEWVAIPFSRGIFPTQGSNPGLLHCRQILHHLSPQGPVSYSHTDLPGLPVPPGLVSALSSSPPGSGLEPSQGTPGDRGWSWAVWCQVSDNRCFIPSVLLFSILRRESKSSSCYSIWAEGRSWIGQGAKKGVPKYFQYCQLLLNKTKIGPFSTSLWINKRLNMQENYVLCDMICPMKESFWNLDSANKWSFKMWKWKIK